MNMTERWRLHQNELTIVVLEIDTDLREFYARMLREAGHHVIGAVDAQHCLELCQEDPPDIVMMNIDSLAMKPAELVQKLRDFAPPEWTAVVVCTGYFLELVQKQFRDGDVAAFMDKNFEPEEVAAKLMKALELRPKGVEVEH